MLEVRADLLGCVQKHRALISSDGDIQKAARECCTDLLEQLAYLRRDLHKAGFSDDEMPVLFTARSRNQCGALVDDAAAVYAVAAVGARAGVEWIDVEANWPALDRHAFVEWLAATYPTTRILGSLHVINDDHDVGQSAAVRLLHSCALGGRADAVKLVVKARDARDSIAVRAAAEEADLGKTPTVAICLGDAGRLSRVLNRAMTPVTHALLETAAPGQLAAKTLMALRRQLFLESRDFFIQQGPDAALLQKAHANAFDRVGLPHRAVIGPTGDHHFGGAAYLTPIPLSEAPVDVVSKTAQRVGFVDTVRVVDQDSEATRGSTFRKGEHVTATALANAVKRAMSQPRPPLLTDDDAAAPTEKKIGLVLASKGAVANAASVALDTVGFEPVIRESLVGVDLDHVAAAVVTGDHDLTPLEGVDILVDFDCAPARVPGDRVLDKHDVLLEIALEQQRLWTSRRPPRADIATAFF